ncbi:chloride channel [Kockovaella imperatae]|uniref:Chloride channel protein n=1 Tax=Kockovaella imperatae TaxID=4999 RepID=A0A1Y1UKR7_9TREE|nr:chloride channel [Kockovaella imperatae]ORX38562.1 chloride channel [Kockovaella imperatae]
MSRPPSSTIETTDEEDNGGTTAHRRQSRSSIAAGQGGTGGRTPRSTTGTTNMGLRSIDSAGSSPRMAQRSSTLDSGRRVSVTSYGAGSSTTIGPGRTLSTPIEGYGATHQNPLLAGFSLGNPEPNEVLSITPSGGSNSLNLSKAKDSALASPRRISTSTPVGPSNTAHQHTLGSVNRTRSPGQMTIPSHEAYYSQPSSTTTPRFKDAAGHHGYYNENHETYDRRQHHLHGKRRGRNDHGHWKDHASTGNRAINTSFLSASTSAASGLHRRTLSVQTTDLAPSTPHSHRMQGSPANSVFRTLRKTASAVGLSVGRPEEYDAGDVMGHDPGEAGDVIDDGGLSANGTRVWYSSFVTIDWIHDAVKESSRVRRLRTNAHKSWRGAIVNGWDRFQGWLVVTIIGILSAVIAFWIIRTEMALFDLKEGYCASSWGSPRRFCCTPHHRRLPGSEEEKCEDWVEWGQFFEPKNKGDAESTWIWGGPEFLAYATVALLLATLASTMTIYLSSSAHTTSKDSTFLLPSPPDPTLKSQTMKQSSSGSNAAQDGTERQPLLSSTSTLDTSEHIEPSEPPRKVMYYAAGSGIPEIKTILSGFVIHGYLGGWTLLTKSVGLALSVASGLSLGKEGPLVHISSCVGNIVSRLFIKFECNEAKRREILSAACAAGVAVAFGAPIGGVLFSLEEVSYYFPPKVMWRSFWCAAVAAITLKSLNPFGNGSLVLFAVTYTKQYHYWEYIIFVLLGVFGGVYGAFFSRLNILWSKHIRQGTWVRYHPIIEVALVTALTTVVSFLNPYCRMGGTELVASLFAECHPGSSSPLCVDHPHEIASVIWTLGSALIIKGCLTIITFGIKLPAGIFIPSLAVGACFGRIVGLAMEYVEFSYPSWGIFEICKDEACIVPGLYAMIGAAATLAGVTRTTVSLAVIVLELTNTLNYVVPVMLGVLVAKTVADGLEKKGIYDLVIDLNQLPYLDSKGEYLWGKRQVLDVADTDVPYLRADKLHTVRSLTGKLLELVRLGMEDTGFPVLVKEHVENDGRAFTALRIVGFLGMNELEHALALLADEPDANLNLMPEDSNRGPRSSVMSIFSFAESYTDPRHNPYDISRYIDRAPITVQIHSPLELVQQLFVKLGARQLLVTDSRGVFRGLVSKKMWLALLSELEEGGAE